MTKLLDWAECAEIRKDITSSRILKVVPAHPSFRYRPLFPPFPVPVFLSPSYPLVAMDSFAEPRKPGDGSVSLADVRAQVQKLEADLRDKDVSLSGRIIHVCHYLPVTCAFSRRSGPSDIPSPPATPPAKAADIPPSPTSEQQQSFEQAETSSAAPASQWTLHARYGHSAMVSGIDSLATTHEQVFVGWTGDIETASAASTPNADGSLDSTANKVPSSSIKEEDRRELEALLEGYRARDEPKECKDIRYVPVWLDDKDAHGHYDGYCKQSESQPSFVLISFLSSLFLFFRRGSPLSRSPARPVSSVEVHAFLIRTFLYGARRSVRIGLV